MTTPTPKSLSLQADGLHARLIVPATPRASLIACIHGGGCNGRYFDLPSFSFAAAAIKAGHAVLAIDRPGHGASPTSAAIAPVRHAAGLVPAVVAKALAELGDHSISVALFGHSIGGAVAMHCAAEAPGMVACLVTSGIGVRPTRAAMAWHGGLGEAGDVLLPHEFFFGPDGSFDWRAPIALRKSAEPWSKVEVDEILLDWPGQFKAVASSIAAPVLCILSEHERIWENDTAAMEMMRSGFAVGRATVEIAAGGGHLYEVHRSWSAHAARIIAFIEEHIK